MVTAIADSIMFFARNPSDQYFDRRATWYPWYGINLVVDYVELDYQVETIKVSELPAVKSESRVI